MGEQEQPNDPLRAIDPMLYDELKAIAASALRSESNRSVPGTTSLVHEVWLRLARSDRNPAHDRQHLLALASLVARRALVDAARARLALKRQRPEAPAMLPEEFASSTADPAEIVTVDELLTQLAESYPRQAKALEMRIFGGIAPERIAEALGISPTQAKRDVAFARSWLTGQLVEKHADRGPASLSDGPEDAP
jgi:RNA polymerase sigma factor (TIGR02999 family)